MASYGSNPFAQPTALDASIPTDARVFTPRQVSIATFLGSPLAGSVLMGLNERALGHGGTAVHAAVGVALTAVVAVAATMAPSSLSSLAALIGVIGMRAYAQAAQHSRTQPLIERGQTGSTVTVVLVGLALLSVIVGGVFALS